MEKEASGGMSLVGVLFVVFLVLKLTKTIAWSWWWVLSPIWISACIWVLIFLIMLITNLIKIKKQK